MVSAATGALLVSHTPVPLRLALPGTLATGASSLADRTGYGAMTVTGSLLD